MQGEEIVNLKSFCEQIPADLLKLPAQLTVDDFKLQYESGTAFYKIHGFIKQTIIDACATSQTIRGDAAIKISSALVTKTGKNVILVISEEHSMNNSSRVYSDHGIGFKVEGVYFIFSIKN